MPEYENLRREDDRRWDEVKKTISNLHETVRLLRQDLNGVEGDPDEIGLKGMFSRYIAVTEIRVKALEKWRTWNLSILAIIIAGLVVQFIKSGGM